VFTRDRLEFLVSALVFGESKNTAYFFFIALTALVGMRLRSGGGGVLFLLTRYVTRFP
jgi:hypothetical protein